MAESKEVTPEATATEPKEITIRLIPATLVLLVEHDGVEVAKEEWFDYKEPVEPGDVMKGIEVVLTSLGWIPDLFNMWIEDTMILRFRKEWPEGWRVR